MTRFVPRALVIGMVLAVACGDDLPAPTTPTTVAVIAPVAEYFIGVMPVRGSLFYSYEVSSPGGTVSLTLASVSPQGSRTASAARLQLGVGVPAGEGCALSQSTTTAAGLTAQLSLSQTPGIYCAGIADVGELTNPVAFAVRIVHP